MGVIVGRPHTLFAYSICLAMKSIYLRFTFLYTPFLDFLHIPHPKISEIHESTAMSTKNNRNILLCMSHNFHTVLHYATA